IAGKSDHFAHNQVFNDSYAAIIAVATASNYGASNVNFGNKEFAEAKGINQGADAYSANNYVDNHGLISAKAFAYTSVGDTGGEGNETTHATAKAYGIDQH